MVRDRVIGPGAGVHRFAGDRFTCAHEIFSCSKAIDAIDASVIGKVEAVISLIHAALPAAVVDRLYVYNLFNNRSARGIGDTTGDDSAFDEGEIQAVYLLPGRDVQGFVPDAESDKAWQHESGRVRV